MGLNVSKQFIDNRKYKLKKYPFDAFFIMSYLEHISNINSFLQGISYNLTDEAIGHIEVPNFDMILKKNLFFRIHIGSFILFFKRYFKNDIKY